MRFFRQIIDDVMSGGVLAGLLAVMILLQGLVGGYTEASAAPDLGVGVICSSHDAETPLETHSPSRHKADCCFAACQLSAASLLILPSGIASPAFTHQRQAEGVPRPLAAGIFRPNPNLPGSPRAPPADPADV